LRYLNVYGIYEVGYTELFVNDLNIKDTRENWAVWESER